MKNILIIEDDISLRPIYEKKLGEAGFHILWESLGEDGIETAKREMPNLILLDIILPGGTDGFEVMKRLKAQEETKGIPIIVTTNMVSEGKKALEAGANDFLIKTNISLKQLVEKVKQNA